MYIHIYRERERATYVSTYICIYVYIRIHIYIYIYIILGIMIIISSSLLTYRYEFTSAARPARPRGSQHSEPGRCLNYGKHTVLDWLESPKHLLLAFIVRFRDANDLGSVARRYHNSSPQRPESWRLSGGTSSETLNRCVV